MPKSRTSGMHAAAASNRRKPIQRLDTTVTAFVGACRTGPLEPCLVKSLGEFERTFGDGQALVFQSEAASPNYLWHAARAFFAQGGRRLYVARVFKRGSGSDGARPTPSTYEGKSSRGSAKGLRALESIPNISIVAAPGSSADFTRRSTDALAITSALIAHAERMKYRFAVLDCGDKQSNDDVRVYRRKMDSSYAALYYPWVRILDPVTNAEIDLPPSGFVTGIFVRNDISKSVSHAPTNEVVSLATGFEQQVTQRQQELLNGEGINCFRTFPGRGNLLWGARTISSNAEFRYVNVRRFIANLEESIARGTQWVVFEPNGQALWADVRRAVEDFLLNEWQSGYLMGDKPEKAFFVRCDRTTMTQNDLDNGRLVCLVGVAPTRPAEFVLFRIGQWTADHKA